MQFHLEAARERAQDAHDERAWLAFHIAFMTAYAPRKSKAFWPLKSLMHSVPKPRVRQTMEEQISIARAWAAALTRK